jgi:Arm DNA-binding domain
MASQPSNEVQEAEVRPTDTDLEMAQTGTRPDLVWDDEAPGLCVRIHGNSEKSFIFVYRRDNHQRFVRIGKTPTWSLEGARRWAKELGSAVGQGADPENYNRERQKIKPVESFIQFIAEHRQSKP